MSRSISADAATILRLTITRFRGIESLTWYPEPGLNIILGGGDAGKTTILDAIGLLLSPTNSTILSESDYWCRQIDTDFVIEAVISLPAGTGVSEQNKMSWPWEWDGKEPQPPTIASDPGPVSGRVPVYRVRVRGTSEFDLSYELVQPDDNIGPFPVGFRRSIGLVRLGGDDRNDRDLRLVHGSALDRLLSDKSLRARLGQQFASEDVKERLSESAKDTLNKLNDAFQEKALPSSLGLSVTGSQGLSIGALVGLTAVKREVPLPLSSWGTGTRRLAALTIASSTQGEYPITIVDEIERGLEPYRQRSLIAALTTSKSQVFLTTHSATALSTASSASLWYLDVSGQIGRLPNAKIARHQARDPETFLARLTIVAEGAAEVGFLSALLERTLEQSPKDCGLWITDGHGHEATLNLLEALAEGGLKFGCFVDNEGLHSSRWSKIGTKLKGLLHRWQTGCLEENIIPLVDPTRLEEFITDPRGEETGERLRTLAIRLDSSDKDFATIRERAGDRMIQLIIEAATGTLPDDKKNADEAVKKAFRKHKERWFKSRSGGRELAEKAISLNALPNLQSQILPFINAVRTALGLPELPSLSL